MTDHEECIKQLNENQFIFNKNIAILDTKYQLLHSLLNEVTRDLTALQRAVIELLKLKNVIQTDEDLQLLQKLHLRQIAQIDQQIAELKNKQDSK